MKKLFTLIAFVCFAPFFAPFFAYAQTATDFSVTVSTVGSTQMSLQGSVDSGTLTYGIYSSGCAGCSAPSHGTLSNFNSSAGTVVYTPTSGYTGSDSFTFTAIKNGSTSSSPATVTITVTSAKTTITDTLTRADGTAYTGTVTFILTQAAASPDSIIPATGTVSATLNGSGQFTVSVYPSTALSPQAYYQVWYASTNSLQREFLGLYAIPASSSTITLSPYKITDTNLTTRYSFVPQSAFNAFLNRSYAVQILKGGTSIGTRGALNIIEGANMSITCTDNSGSGRVDCTFADPTGGSGGTVGSATSGQVAVYNGATSVTGKTFGGANRILKTNSSNNDTEWATVTAGTGITVTPGTNDITIATTAVTTLNGLTGATQTFTASTGTCGSNFAITSASTTHTFCVPTASATAAGLVTASSTAQTIAGAKTFTGFGASDTPLTVKQVGSGSTTLQSWQDSSATVYGAFNVASATTAGMYANKFGGGNALSAPLAGYTVAVNHAQSSDGYSGMLLATTTTANDTTGNLRGAYITYMLDGTGTHTAAALRSAAVDAQFSFTGSGTLTNVAAVRGMIYNDNTGTITQARGFASTAELTNGTATNFSHFYAIAPTLSGSGAITNQYGLYVESLTGATNNWGVYTAGTTGSSFGGFLDLRGRSAPAVSGSGELRLYADTSGNLKASANAAAYGSVPIWLSGTGTLDFPSISAQSQQTLTITVTGATTGKPVILGIPTASVTSGVTYYGYVSATNTVTVVALNVTSGSADPASGSFTAYVIQ